MEEVYAKYWVKMGWLDRYKCLVDRIKNGSESTISHTYFRKVTLGIAPF